MSEFQATWLHLFIISEYCHNQGLQVCLVIARLHFPVIKSAGQVCCRASLLPGKSAARQVCCRASLLPGKSAAGQVCCRASLPGKSAGQVCRASLPGKSAGRVCRASLTGKSDGQVCWASLPGMSAGQVCRASLIMSNHIYQLSAEILPSLIKGRHPNNKAKCIPGGTLRVLAGKKCRLPWYQSDPQRWTHLA
jgi:hypothetical protein